MINFENLSFNGQYLRALGLAAQGQHVTPSRVGDVINMGQAFFDIEPNDPRIIFLHQRRLNALFAVVEGCWVLEGSNDLAPLSREIASYGEFSDDGITLNGAYGYRLRSHFNVDQIDRGLDILRRDPDSRRVVLSLYHVGDLGKQSKDIPCNTSIFIKIVDRKLDLTVINRSNDLYLGVPYNVFTFGLLQRYLAAKLGVEIGNQRHFTDSLHLYLRDKPKAEAVFRSNHLAEVEETSARFDWGYSSPIVDSAEIILRGDFQAVACDSLRRFLLWLSAADRTDTAPQGYNDGFYDFLADRVIGRRATR
ncbi:thymidylate synthase [Burkholderia vietnamiensis]|uniref:thymidylate synthase n=1 Tax=Burkholderia vietnamiensis TaxID=60552 RepID=UPI00158C8B07|nr:thymidylate synthase [Burkholderia vietnamiensis]